MNKTWVKLRPVIEADLAMLRRFVTESGLAGSLWSGYHDPAAIARRFAADGFLGEAGGRLVVEVDDTAAGYVAWDATGPEHAPYWAVGIALLPEWRGRGVGWRAQTLLCDYLFAHTAAQRIEATVLDDNVAETKALEKVGFHKEGVLRSAEFRDGRWRDVTVFGRVRGDR
jgi:[ribosomal protein S5]-alanine N-acetyltransferase